MTPESCVFRERVRFALSAAVKGSGNPKQQVDLWMRWLDEGAPCPDGTKGFLGKRITWSRTAEDTARLHERVRTLRAAGLRNEEIAEQVGRSVGHIEHLVCDLGLTRED